MWARAEEVGANVNAMKTKSFCRVLLKNIGEPLAWMLVNKDTARRGGEYTISTTDIENAK